MQGRHLCFPPTFSLVPQWSPTFFILESPLFKPPVQDFLTTVLVFKPHIFSRDSLVAFNSYQSKKQETCESWT